MTDLEQMIEMAEKLCHNLDKISQNERRFCLNVCIEFEKMSWEILKLKNDLESIKNYCEV